MKASKLRIDVLELHVVLARADDGALCPTLIQDVPTPITPGDEHIICALPGYVSGLIDFVLHFDDGVTLSADERKQLESEITAVVAQALLEDARDHGIDAEVVGVTRIDV